MSFVFRPVLSVATLVALGVLVSLGAWQLHRLGWKEGLIARTNERIGGDAVSFELADKLFGDGQDAEYIPVEQVGVFRHDLEAHVFGTLDGAPGYYVFTPLALPDFPWVEDAHLYVNRGFVPQALKTQGARTDGLVTGEVVVRGLFRAPEAAGGLADALRPIGDREANVWHARRPADFAEAAGIRALDVYVDSLGEENPGAWPKGGTTRLSFNNRHREYALTWFGLAGALIAVYGAFSVGRPPSVPDRTSDKRST